MQQRSLSAGPSNQPQRSTEAIRRTSLQSQKTATQASRPTQQVSRPVTQARRPPVQAGGAAIQAVTSTGAIRRVPGVAVRVPIRSPETPPQRRSYSAPASSRRQVRAAPPLDAAMMKAVQQAMDLGVSLPLPQFDYPEDYERGIGVIDRRTPIPQGKVGEPLDPDYDDDSLVDFEELEKIYEQLHTPPYRDTYKAPESIRDFEQLEQEVHLDAVAAPDDIQELLHVEPQLDVYSMRGQQISRPLPQQGPRSPSDLRLHMSRQWERSRSTASQPSRISPSPGRSFPPPNMSESDRQWYEMAQQEYAGEQSARSSFGRPSPVRLTDEDRRWQSMDISDGPGSGGTSGRNFQFT
ncbi:hypothetical protein JTB14_013969 [Gonioctena quinquepunctata]|nr:hypothetical protein JTB14_013969 [Gonioctena quinquepunctata]